MKIIFFVKITRIAVKSSCVGNHATIYARNVHGSHRIGRTYEDFNLFLEENPDTPVVEMDTVHRTRSGKVLLTFFFRKSSLMLAFIIESCTQIYVADEVHLKPALLRK